jgi:hypothetical protein
MSTSYARNNEHYVRRRAPSRDEGHRRRRPSVYTRDDELLTRMRRPRLVLEDDDYRSPLELATEVQPNLSGLPEHRGPRRRSPTIEVAQHNSDSFPTVPTDLLDHRSAGLRVKGQDHHTWAELEVRLTEVASKHAEDTMLSFLETSTRALRYNHGYARKPLYLSIVLQPGPWADNRGHKIAGKIVAWTKDWVSSLKLALPRGDNKQLFEEGSDIHSGQFPFLESVRWMGDVTHHFLSRLPFTQLTTLTLQPDHDLSLDDCIELLSRCNKIVAFSNFEPKDHSSALAVTHPRRYPPILHNCRRSMLRIPTLKSLSLSSTDVMPLFYYLSFPELLTLRIRVTDFAPQKLHDLPIAWLKLNELTIYANMKSGSSRRIAERCRGNAIHYHQKLDGCIIKDTTYLLRNR